jgi:hypothetical protein
MAIFYDLLARLCQFFFFITSWLVQGLTFIACSLEPTPDLPVASNILFADIESQGGRVLISVLSEEGDPLVATHERVRRGPPKQLNLPRIALERVKIQEQNLKATHTNKSKPHDLFGSPLGVDATDIQVNIEHKLSVNGLSPEVSDSSSWLPSPTPSPYFSPSLTNSMATFPMASPCPSPKIIQYDPVLQYQYFERVLSIDNTVVKIGDLGKRRGFKGAPLFTQYTSKGSLLSLPILSPQSGSPNLAHLASPKSLSSDPRTPFATVSNLMRSASPKSPRPIKEVSQDFQDFYDEGDPFATYGKTFFTPSFSFGIVLTANLDNFAPYYQHKPTHRRMPPLKRRSHYDNLRSASCPINTVLMQTTIYDLAISVDLPSAPISAKSRNTSKRILKPSTHPSVSTGCFSPKIMLTSPSIPSSPTRTICSMPATFPTDMQESSHSLQLPAKHTKSSKVKTKLKGMDPFISDPFSCVPGPVVILYDLGACEASPTKLLTESKLSSDPGSGANVCNSLMPDLKMNLTDEPAAAVTRISQDCSENALTSVSLPDIKHKQDQEDTFCGSGLSPPLFVSTADIYEFSAYRSLATDTSPPLRRNIAHADLLDVTPTKPRTQPIAKLDTNIYDLAIDGVDVNLPKLKKCTRRSQLRLTNPHLEESDLITPLAHVKRASSFRPLVLPMRVTSSLASAASHGTSADSDDIVPAI